MDFASCPRLPVHFCTLYWERKYFRVLLPFYKKLFCNLIKLVLENIISIWKKKNQYYQHSPDLAEQHR